MSSKKYGALKIAFPLSTRNSGRMQAYSEVAKRRPEAWKMALPSRVLSRAVAHRQFAGRAEGAGTSELASETSTRVADIHSQTDTQHLEAFFRRPATGIRPLPTCSGADLRADRTHAITRRALAARGRVGSAVWAASVDEGYTTRRVIHKAGGGEVGKQSLISLDCLDRLLLHCWPGRRRLLSGSFSLASSVVYRPRDVLMLNLWIRISRWLSRRARVFSLAIKRVLAFKRILTIRAEPRLQAQAPPPPPPRPRPQAQPLPHHPDQMTLPSSFDYRPRTSDLAYRRRRARASIDNARGLHRRVGEVWTRSRRDVAEGEEGHCDVARGIEEGLEAVGEVAGDDVAEGRGGVAEVVRVDFDVGEGRWS
ncbi:hypothetical protein FB107DRAFT_249387 [Schizophyllum commune]